MSPEETPWQFPASETPVEGSELWSQFSKPPARSNRRLGCGRLELTLSNGGLGLSTIRTRAIFLVAILVLVGYLSITQDRLNTRQ